MVAPTEHKTFLARILEYAEAEDTLLGQSPHLETNIYGNREFVEHLRKRGKFFDHEEKRERDTLIKRQQAKANRGKFQFLCKSKH